MTIYMIYIKTDYIDKLSNYYASTYISKSHLYAYTTSKKYIKRFKEERNMDAFVIIKNKCNDDASYKYFKMNEGCNIELNNYDFACDGTNVSILTTAYERDYIAQTYLDDVIITLRFKLSNFTYDIFKYDIIMLLDKLFVTYFKDSGSLDGDIISECEDNYDQGILPAGTMNLRHRPNVISIINYGFGALFKK